MIIPITEKYCIRLGEYDWQICKWIVRKGHSAGGKWEPFLFYPTLEKAALRLVERLGLEAIPEGVEAVITAQREAAALVAAAIRESRIPSSCMRAHQHLKEVNDGA